MKTEVRLELDRRAVFAEGRPFGDAGPYERLTGRVRFALDPADAHATPTSSTWTTLRATVVDSLSSPATSTS